MNCCDSLRVKQHNRQLAHAPFGKLQGVVLQCGVNSSGFCPSKKKRVTITELPIAQASVRREDKQNQHTCWFLLSWNQWHPQSIDFWRLLCSEHTSKNQHRKTENGKRITTKTETFLPILLWELSSGKQSSSRVALIFVCCHFTSVHVLFYICAFAILHPCMCHFTFVHVPCCRTGLSQELLPGAAALHIRTPLVTKWCRFCGRNHFGPMCLVSLLTVIQYCNKVAFYNMRHCCHQVVWKKYCPDICAQDLRELPVENRNV